MCNANEELKKEYGTHKKMSEEEKKELFEKNSQLLEDLYKLVETLELLETKYDETTRQKLVLTFCYKKRLDNLNETIESFKKGDMSNFFIEHENRVKSLNEKLLSLHLENENLKNLLKKISEKDSHNNQQALLITENQQLKKDLFELKVKFKRSFKEKQKQKLENTWIF